ncbi:MAG: four-helix bundle copper-binding protein [Bacteroides sp.]|nr:four-helix bundle copper-binding protein [Bacteroides sp.]
MMDDKVKNMNRMLGKCVAVCNFCFDSCLREENVEMMKECIRLDKECAEICALTLSLVASGSEMAGEALTLCAAICEKCGEECGKHDNDHCRKCAETCLACAEACRNY